MLDQVRACRPDCNAPGSALCLMLGEPSPVLKALCSEQCAQSRKLGAKLQVDVLGQIERVMQVKLDIIAPGSGQFLCLLHLGSCAAIAWNLCRHLLDFYAFPIRTCRRHLRGLMLGQQFDSEQYVPKSGFQILVSKGQLAGVFTCADPLGGIQTSINCLWIFSHVQTLASWLWNFSMLPNGLGCCYLLGVRLGSVPVS